MAIKKITGQCRSCKTEINTKYEVNLSTINQELDRYGNIITLNRKDGDLYIVTVSIKCPNPKCNKKNLLTVKFLA